MEKQKNEQVAKESKSQIEDSKPQTIKPDTGNSGNLFKSIKKRTKIENKSSLTALPNQEERASIHEHQFSNISSMIIDDSFINIIDCALTLYNSFIKKLQ